MGKKPRKWRVLALARRLRGSIRSIGARHAVPLHDLAKAHRAQGFQEGHLSQGRNEGKSREAVATVRVLFGRFRWNAIRFIGFSRVKWGVQAGRGRALGIGSA